jgi:hypothetical protein
VFHSGYVEIEVEKGGRRKPKPTDKLKKCSETEYRVDFIWGPFRQGTAWVN